MRLDGRTRGAPAARAGGVGAPGLTAVHAVVPVVAFALTLALALPLAVVVAGPVAATASVVGDPPAREDLVGSRDRDRRGIDVAAIDAYLEEEVAASPLPGLAVAITHGDDVVHLGGYGLAGDGRAMTPGTPVLVGSLSKSFTAAAVLQLVEAGVLDLDAPVSRYLPGFAPEGADPATPITVRDLLNHTSGLADRGFDDLWRLDQRSPAERVQSVNGARLVAEPGTTFHYFNPNYEVLARLVEVGSGEDFDDYLQGRVLGPLAMRDTSSVRRVEQARVVEADLADGHLILFGSPVTTDEPPGYAAGSGGVVSTASDLARWLVAHGNRGRLDDTAVLSPASVGLAHTPPDGIDTTYGMGWWTGAVAGQRVLEHNGVLATSSAEQVLLPDSGHGIVLLANANHAFSDVPRIKEGLVALLAGAEPGEAPMTHRRVVLLVVSLAAIGLAVRVRGFVRRDGWARRHASSPAWRRGLGIGRLLLPAVILAGLPGLIVLVMGRAFPHRLLVLAAPEFMAWLALAALTGATLAAARTLALRRRTPRPPFGARMCRCL